MVLTPRCPRAPLLPSLGCVCSPDPQVSGVLTGFCGPTCRCKPSLLSEAEEAAQELENQIKERQGLFFDMEAYLPKKNG